MASDVVGFYSLSSLSLDIGDLPEDLARRLPRYEAIPATLIGRLARDGRVRGEGIGSSLLVDAIQRLLSATQSVAAFVIVVDARDDDAAAFYERFGFRRFVGRPERLFLPTSAAQEILRRL